MGTYGYVSSPISQHFSYLSYCVWLLRTLIRMLDAYTLYTVCKNFNKFVDLVSKNRNNSIRMQISWAKCSEMFQSCSCHVPSKFDWNQTVKLMEYVKKKNKSCWIYFILSRIVLGRQHHIQYTYYNILFFFAVRGRIFTLATNLIRSMERIIHFRIHQCNVLWSCIIFPFVFPHFFFWFYFLVIKIISNFIK